MSAQYELYRRSSLGIALTDTLDELIQCSMVDPHTAMKILAQFDSCMSEILRDRVRVKSSIKGHLHIYRFCDDVWTFVIDDPIIRLNSGEVLQINRLKIVACTARGVTGPT